jgi:hypothetical protein
MPDVGLVVDKAALEYDFSLAFLPSPIFHIHSSIINAVQS